MFVLFAPTNLPSALYLNLKLLPVLSCAINSIPLIETLVRFPVMSSSAFHCNSNVDRKDLKSQVTGEKAPLEKQHQRLKLRYS